MNALAAVLTVLGFIGMFIDFPFAIWIMLYGIITSTDPDRG